MKILQHNLSSEILQNINMNPVPDAFWWTFAFGVTLTAVIWWSFKLRNHPHGDSNELHVLILYCEYTSHSYWSKTYAKYSHHTVSTMSIDGSNFKWRMQSSAIAFANEFIRIFHQESNPTINDSSNLKNQIRIKSNIKSSVYPNIIIIDDLIDLNVSSNIIRSHSHPRFQCKTIKFIYFMHENQLTIPWKSSDRGRDHHWIYGLQNFKCMLGADQVWWNSTFHQNDFLNALPKVIRNKSNDDWTGIAMIDNIRRKSKTMYLPMDYMVIDQIDTLRSTKAMISQQIKNRVDAITTNQQRTKIVLWNARWESDKNPSLFLYALRHLKTMKDVSFKLVILGENFSFSKDSKHADKSGKVFEDIRREFKEEILQFGFVESYQEYIGWLSVSDILIVTSNHEFFGISLMESMYCGVVPVLPKHLVYTEHFQRVEYPFLYRPNAKGQLVKLMRGILQKDECGLNELRGICINIAMQYDANRICKKYDSMMSSL